MKLSRARYWFHTVARISSICYLAGGFSAYAVILEFRGELDRNVNLGGGFGFSMVTLLMASWTCGFLASVLGGPRDDKPLSPLWPYVVLNLVSIFVAPILIPAVH